MKPTAVPLHHRIRADIEEKILSGEWGPGARIPVEHELMARYGCSRMTVSKALSALTSAGLIDRRKRAGSFVASPRAHSMVLDIPDIASEVRDRGATYAFELLSREVRAARADDRQELELAPRGQLLSLRGVHHADGRPLALEDRIISLAAVPEAREVDFTVTPPGTWLLHHVPWTEAENRISAVEADAESARLLGLRPRSACLAVDRRTWRGTERVTTVRQLFNGGSYDLIARFQKTGAPAEG